MSIAADDRVLTIERVFRTTAEELFDAWTRPELLLQWWGPEGTTVHEHALDISEGGAWMTTMVGGEGDRHTVSGIYRVIDRPHRLVLTWGWRQPDGSRGHETVVEIRFERVPEGTRQTLQQKTFQSAEQRDNHDKGWSSSFKELERFLSGAAGKGS